MKKALVVHPGFDVIGGAEKVSLHIINYLIQKQFDVTLLTLDLPDINFIRETTEFELIEDQLNVIKAYCPAFIVNSAQLTLIRLAFMHRSAKKMAPNFDLCISTYNELNFGKKGIQYIHHPFWPKRHLLHHYHTIANFNILDRHSIVENIYQFAAHFIAGNFKGFSENITLVNSKFIKDVVKKIYDIDGEILYPGFLTNDDFYSGNFQKRPFQIVTISRLTPDKNIIELIKAFENLSDKDMPAKMIIAGFITDRQYFDRIKNYIFENNLPIQLKTNLNREEVFALLKESQYFISTKKYEHFGISVLEAAAAGCIPVVHRSGGTKEIVPFKELQYDQIEELPNLILSLKKTPQHLIEIQSALNKHLQQFKLEAFYQRLDEIITNFLHPK